MSVTEERQNSKVDVQLILFREEIQMFSVAAAVFFHKELNAALGQLFWKLPYWQISVLFLPSNIEEPVLFSAYYFLVPMYHSL